MRQQDDSTPLARHAHSSSRNMYDNTIELLCLKTYVSGMRCNNPSYKSDSSSWMIRDSIRLSLDMERSDGYNDLEWAIGLNRLMLKIIGLWPPDNRDPHETLKSKIRLLCSIITLLFILAIPSFLSLLRVWGDIILVVDNLIYSLPVSIAIIKVFIIWYKQEDLVSLIKMIAIDWMKPKMKEERDVMLKFAKISRIIAICGCLLPFIPMIVCFALIYFGLTLRHVTNLTDSGKPLMVQTYYLHNVSKSPQFELTVVAQGVALFITCVSYYAIDHFLGLLVLHIYGQMENLHTRLTHMERYINFDSVLKYNVQDHNRLIRSIEIINDSFDLVLLVIIIYFGIIFCLLGFLIVNVLNDDGQMSLMQLGWYVAATITILLHMGLYCAVGETLVTQCKKIHRATYDYTWYTLDPKASRNLILIMLRASKPLYITAGKTFPMTMATFCNLLKTSTGYISVLLAKQD
ncbi:odorant receptor Or2-like isoform X2 [Harpegnathos saltator]|uniref:odorant receptor Or2-like isoform X2 n=1 Tax=Harpegnathos saltator TaxID=610380 RepID=UPI000DBED382|nr:odorant receptor Or2-like isoform X2 [Harpegnathos saltator]